MSIRSLESQDFSAWLPLWDGNNLGTRDEAVTKETWRRLLDPQSQVFGLGAFTGGQAPALIGLLHYILHPTTGSISPVCYMQDVYVDPACRGQGIAKALVMELSRLGHKAKWARIYWLADAQNQATQGLYKNIGFKLNFTLHVLPLGKI